MRVLSKYAIYVCVKKKLPIITCVTCSSRFAGNREVYGLTSGLSNWQLNIFPIAEVNASVMTHTTHFTFYFLLNEL